MYPKTISKHYEVLCKYKTPTNSTRLTHKYIVVIFHQRGDGNQNYPPTDGTYDVLHRDDMCYNCDSPGHYYGQCTLPDCRRTGTHSLQLGYSFDQTTPVQK